MAVLLLVLMAPAQAAQPGQLLFDFAAQPLPRALERFSEQTGISILVTSDLIRNKSAAPVRGRMAPGEALARLLKNTGLDARRIGEASMTLVPRSHDTATPLPAAMAALPPAYASRLQEQVARLLCRHQPGGFGHYRLGLQLWVDAHGQVLRVHTLASQQAHRWAKPVRAALLGASLSAPPAGLPQPITLLLLPSPAGVSSCPGEEGD